MSDGDVGTSDLSDIGQATCGQTHVKCAEVDEAASATAKLLFVSGEFAHLCSGVLVADRNTSNTIPYLMTAAHCIMHQAEADSLITFWDFEKAECGGANPTQVTQHTGGAVVMATEYWSDHTLLKLNSPPPGDRHYMGWNPETISFPTDVYGVHHPRGDLKRHSEGSAVAFEDISLNYGSSVLNLIRANLNNDAGRRQQRIRVVQFGR